MYELKERNRDYRGNPRNNVCETSLNSAIEAHLRDVRVTAIGLGFNQRTLDRSGGSPRVVCP